VNISKLRKEAREHLQHGSASSVIIDCANLAGADLSDADLAGVDLARADLSDANLAGAYVGRSRPAWLAKQWDVRDGYAMRNPL